MVSTVHHLLAIVWPVEIRGTLSKIEISELTAFGNVLMYDHIGFGFSDKPTKDFTYSIFELADYSIMLFKELQLKDIILIGTDLRFIYRFNDNMIYGYLMETFELFR